MEFYISPQSGQFYMINVLENQWLSVTYTINYFYSFIKRNMKSSFWNQQMALWSFHPCSYRNMVLLRQLHRFCVTVQYEGSSLTLA